MSSEEPSSALGAIVGGRDWGPATPSSISKSFVGIWSAVPSLGRSEAWVDDVGSWHEVNLGEVGKSRLAAGWPVMGSWVAVDESDTA